MPNSRRLSLLVVAVAILALACGDPVDDPTQRPQTTGSVSSGATSANSWCSSMTFTADVHGAPATAKLAYEPHFEMGYVSGSITSQAASYSFYGDTPIDVHTKLPTSSVMWVEVTELATGERFRAEINWRQHGFLFTTNPFGGGGATSYAFTCVP